MVSGIYAPPNVCFSNRPVWVKRLQTFHHCGFDVAHGLVLLFGIGAEALPSWDSRTRRNNLSVGLALLMNDRSKRTYDLTSSIVPRGTSIHRKVEFGFPPIGFDLASSCSRSFLPAPTELGPINPDAVHDDRQPACQGYDRLFQAAASGDLHRPGLKPGPFC